MQRPFAGRARVQERGDALEIEIPTRKNWFLLLFMGVWLAGVIFVLLFMIPTFFNSTSTANSASSVTTFPWVLWLAGFGGGVIFIAYTWLRHAFGVEVTQVLHGSISIGERILFWERGRSYQQSDLLRLRTQQVPEPNWFDQSNFYSTGAPSLAFDYGARTVRFGRGIDEAEARQLLERIVAKFPQYGEALPVARSPYLYTRP